MQSHPIEYLPGHRVSICERTAVGSASYNVVLSISIIKVCPDGGFGVTIVLLPAENIR